MSSMMEMLKMSNIDMDKKIEDLLKILICPISGGKLTYNKKKQELVSSDAKLAFPIIDGIPVLLIEKARKI